MFETRPDRTDEVALIGRSNVGKSTIMREITGHTFSTGGKPGVTREPNHYDWASDDFVITDLPGFGYMQGVPEERQESIKTDIVHYLEEYADNILVGVIVLDGKSAVDIIDRHTTDESIPHTVEMYGLLRELGVDTVIAVNKMDKVDDKDERLDEIADRFGLLPPWKQWTDTIAPITAKKGNIGALEDAINSHLEDHKRHDLKKFF